MTSPAQQKKFETFLKHPLHVTALELVKQAIAAAALEQGELGKSWGVTLCPDNKTVIRLNCGNISLLDVSHGSFEPDDDDIYIKMAVIDEELGILGPPRSIAMYEGFTAHVESSMLLMAPWDKWSGKIFDNKKICRAFKAHAHAAKRTLPHPNWHNPMAEALLA